MQLGGVGGTTNAYKWIQGGRGVGLNMTKNTHFVPRLVKNATISEIMTIGIPFNVRQHRSLADLVL